MKPSPVRVLLVDDDEDDYLILKGLLFEAMQPRPELKWVSRYDAAQREVEHGDYDVYLIDYRLGEKSGLELLKPLDLSQRREPFIILTGVGDESVERQAMEIGVADYLVKGKFEAELLRRVIEYSLQRKRMEAQRVRHLLELNRSKDEFIAVTSHQLRTPATAVKQYLSVLMGGFAGEMTEKQMSLVQRAYSTNDRQLKIVNDILRIAQLDLQEVELHPETIDIRELVENCVQEMKVTTEDREQTIEMALPDKRLSVTCDQSFTSMAICNLLDNASKYSESGTTIQLSVRRTGSTIEIDITDQGVGIGKADLQKLFKKFSRVDNPLSHEVGGTGLGLYWAKAITVMQGGDIRVSSELSAGTTFTVVLPVAKKSEAK